MIRFKSGTDVDLRCLDVTSISVSKALLWHAVKVRSPNRVDVLSCLGEEVATKLAADLYMFINNHLSKLIGSETDHLSDVGEKLRAITEGQRQYLQYDVAYQQFLCAEQSASSNISKPGRSRRVSSLEHIRFNPDHILLP